jgi:hypothetical protein
MDQRTVAGTFCSALFASSAAVVIGAAALPQASPYFVAMLAIGSSGISASLVGFAWLFFTRPREIPPEVPLGEPLLPESEEPLTDTGKALRVLKRARDNAVIAAKRRDEHACRLASDELFAAFLSIDREFDLGCGRMEFRGGSSRALVRPMLALADTIYPLLREGHIEQARSQTASFKWPAP